MEVLLNETVGRNCSETTERGKIDHALFEARGTWQEVDTTYLFRDQYSLKNINARVMDSNIQAVRDDERRGACRCNYCGETFKTIDAYNAHIKEGEKKAAEKTACAGCFWYQSEINSAATERKRETIENADGSKREIKTTIWHYTAKKCTFEHAGGCKFAACGIYKPEIFTEENTYFLRYPNGWRAYYDALPDREKWAEMCRHEHGRKYEVISSGADGYTVKYTDAKAGTYSARLMINNNGTLDALIIENSRRQYVLEIDAFKTALANITFYAPHMAAFLGIEENAPNATKEAAALLFRGIVDTDNEYKHNYNNLVMQLLGINAGNIRGKREQWSEGGSRERAILEGYTKKEYKEENDGQILIKYIDENENVFAVWSETRRAWVN